MRKAPFANFASGKLASKRVIQDEIGQHRIARNDLRVLCRLRKIKIGQCQAI